MIGRLIVLNFIIVILLWGIGRIITTPELRKATYYPFCLGIASTLITITLVFLERAL